MRSTVSANFRKLDKARMVRSLLAANVQS
jgi:hypothetical protein